MNNQYPSSPGQQKSSLFSRFILHIKLVVTTVCLWALCYSINSVMKNSIALEYDGGLTDSTVSWDIMKTSGLKPYTAAYWKQLNSMAGEDPSKPVPGLMCVLAKFLGLKVHLICDREQEGGETLRSTWKKTVSYIHFAPEPNDKYILLEKYRPFIYAASSDEGLAQAVKAGIIPIRIKRAAQTKIPGTYTPGKFGEKSIPLSHLH